MRATFIIDRGGIVRHTLVNDLDVGRNPEETLRTLQALRTGALLSRELAPRAADAVRPGGRRRRGCLTR